MRGKLSSKVMVIIIRNALMIRNAVAPFMAMLVSRAAGALSPIETNSTRSVAPLNRKKPGINETMENARAAKGGCRRSALGVTMRV
jgi:hypothetical protein